MTALLALDSVSLRIDRGRHSVQVLDEASLTLHAGELGGVWGRRGAGNTTLALVAAGILTPNSGTVRLDGQPLNDRTRSVRGGALHARIGLATRQGPQFEELAIVDWVAMSLLSSHTHAQATALAKSALDRTGISQLAAVRWDELSHGERMLASIARAIVRGPRLVVVDDPIAGLGAAERGEIMQFLLSLAALGVGVLVTAAELIELQGMDRIWSLREGRLEGPSVRPVGEVVPLRSSDLRGR